MGQLEIQCFHNVLIYPISVTRDSIRFDKEMEGLLHRVKNSERVFDEVLLSRKLVSHFGNLRDKKEGP